MTRIKQFLSALCITACTALPVLAQGDIDFLFENTVHTTYDFQVILKIRRASQVWDRLGTSNFPFYYNHSALTNPVLVTAHNFSGGMYGDMSLVNNGSWASVNTLFNGSDGQGTAVPDSWIDAATIHFTITDPSGTSGITMRTDGAYAVFDDDEQTMLQAGACTGLDVPLLDTGVDDKTAPIPEKFAVGKGFPNPFNMSITLQYQLPRRSSVTVSIVSVTGAKIQEITFPEKPAGYHTFTWNGKTHTGTSESSGVYLVFLRAGSRAFSRKITLLKYKKCCFPAVHFLY